VYTGAVRNITLSAEEDLIERARLRAAREKTTLNAAFRDWLFRYAGTETSSQEYRELMKRLKHVRPGKHFSRDELNER
jgi:hypothetical protein